MMHVRSPAPDQRSASALNMIVFPDPVGATPSRRLNSENFAST
jgi:hypothetical protein